MGTWGTALFSDDVASDIRQEFKTLIGNGLTSNAATNLMVQTWGSPSNDPNEVATFWLALASTQWTLGRLIPRVRDEALRILDGGGDLHRWEHDTVGQSKRRYVLERLRTQLVSVPPATKKILRQFKNSNNWLVGSVHAYTLTTGEFCLLRVIGHHTDEGGTAPIVELLDWIGTEIPGEQIVSLLKVRRYRYPNGREISQFLLCSTSERELKSVRIAATGIVSRAEQKPGGFTAFLCRNLDADFAKYFDLGNSCR